MRIDTPADIHPAVEKLFNVRDVDGLVSLYEPDACMVGPDGAEARGLDAIRATWAEVTSAGLTLSLETVYVVERGDIAMLRNDYEVRIGDDVVAKSGTSEVVRRQPEGNWLYIIDHPYAVPMELT